MPKHARHGPSRFEHVKGAIEINPHGYGFLSPEQGGEDIFIPAPKLGSALPGDTVLARLKPGRPRSGHREGSVVKILERKLRDLVGFFNGVYLVPRDERISVWFYVPPSKTLKAVAGDLVRAVITSYPSASGQAEAEIAEVLGKELTVQLESRIILRQYGFPEEFSGPVEQELGSIPETVSKEDARDRVDLSHVPFVTIDPVDAKDFDDAVCVNKFEWGYRLWVAIADVSHYVRHGAQIDLQAFQRATSVYFPDRAIPMLPAPISSGVASLRPGEDRLAMVAELDFDPAAKSQRSKFYPALIRSRFRMNYHEVQSIYDKSDPDLAARYEPVLLMLDEAAELVRALNENRRHRGAIDLDLPEAHIELDEKGEPKDIFAYPRFFSHRLVEELMLQANQAVAEFLSRKKFAFPFRIHEPPAPDKIQELNLFLSGLGFPLLAKDKGPHQVRPKDFQRLMQRAEKTTLSELISYLALRAMMQAKYSVENKGHFGLALSHYCHFTSPIRRYPDLMVHRILKQALGVAGEGYESAPAGLSEACEHCSERERAASNAERGMAKVYQAKLMAGRLGEEFTGTISGLSGDGIFVELSRPMAEGLVPGSSLPGYDYNPRLHTAFTRSPRMELHLGDRVLVEVEAVELERHTINFRLIGLLESAFKQPAASIFPRPKKEHRPAAREKPRKRKPMR